MGAHSGSQNPPDPFVFVAHKSEDKARIRPIVEALLLSGFSVWIDDPDKFDPRLVHARLHRLEAGELYLLRIPEYIRNAGCVLVIWSAGAVASRDVLAEANMALELGKLVPVRIDEVMAPYTLGDIQTPNLSDALRQPELSNDGAFGAVVDVIRRKISSKPRTAWEHYQGLIRPGDYQIAFVPLINPDAPMATTFKYGAIEIFRDPTEYKLPEAFESTPIEAPREDLKSCRLVEWGATGAKLQITFSPVKYSDYLKSGEHLDSPLPDDPSQTFREHFASKIPGPDDSLRDFPLTNICGVGLFIVTHDNQVLITRHSSRSHVYPRRWTFSASGTVRWGASPNPFTEVLWKCRQETNHQIDISRLELVELGVDARKLFFEFCFVERTDALASDLIANFPSGLEYDFVPLSPVTQIAEHVTENCWEPAAEATLLALAMKEHSVDRTLKHLEKRGNWRHHQMRDEWDFRASRRGSLAVMSVRYPQDRLEGESADYVAEVLRFMGDDIKGRRVLEVGSGIGRITRELVQVCSYVTGVDLCERMHMRNEQALGPDMHKVSLETDFIQTFKTKQEFDVALCSLVLIHNVDPADFDAAIEVMCRHARSVFVFEDATDGRQTGLHTNLLSEAKLREAFAKFNFSVERMGHYQLFGDAIVFLKFARANQPQNS